MSLNVTRKIRFDVVCRQAVSARLGGQEVDALGCQPHRTFLRDPVTTAISGQTCDIVGELAAACVMLSLKVGAEPIANHGRAELAPRERTVMSRALRKSR